MFKQLKHLASKRNRLLFLSETQSSKLEAWWGFVCKRNAKSWMIKIDFSACNLTDDRRSALIDWFRSWRATRSRSMSKAASKRPNETLGHTFAETIALGVGLNSHIANNNRLEIDRLDWGRRLAAFVASSHRMLSHERRWPHSGGHAN